MKLTITLEFMDEFIYTTFQLNLKGMNIFPHTQSIINVPFDFQQVVAV